jgi:hypothetical protein
MKIKNKTRNPYNIMIISLIVITNSRIRETPKEELLPNVATEVVSEITSTSACCTGNVISCGGSTWV